MKNIYLCFLLHRKYWHKLNCNRPYSKICSKCGCLWLEHKYSKYTSQRRVVYRLLLLLIFLWLITKKEGSYMDETWKIISEYALRAWQGTEWSTIVVSGFMLLLISMVAYYRSNRYQEQMVSKRSQKARRKAATELIEQRITEVLEAAHKAGDLPREEVDAAYSELKKTTRFRSVGVEPTFGKPWYEPVKSKAADVKKGIKRRLKAAGVNINTALHSMKQRKEVPASNGKGLRALRKHSQPA